MNATTMTMYTTAQDFGRDASFLANVIMCHHRNPARKLRGLVELLRSGHECRTGQFAIDVLLIDGCRVDWSVLESKTVLSDVSVITKDAAVLS